MLASSPAMIRATALLTVGAIAWLAWAGPFVPATSAVPDTLRSLVGMQAVHLVLRPLPVRLAESEFSPALARRQCTDRLQEAGYETDGEPRAPRLFLRCVCLAHPDDDRHSYVLTLTLEQPVHVRRLNASLRLPTYVNLIVGMEDRAGLGTQIQAGYVRLIDTFIAQARTAGGSEP